MECLLLLYYLFSFITFWRDIASKNHEMVTGVNYEPFISKQLLLLPSSIREMQYSQSSTVGICTIELAPLWGICNIFSQKLTNAWQMPQWGWGGGEVMSRLGIDKDIIHWITSWSTSWKDFDWLIDWRTGGGMDRGSDGPTDGWTDRQTDRRTHRLTDWLVDWFIINWEAWSLPCSCFLTTAKPILLRNTLNWPERKKKETVTG